MVLIGTQLWTPQYAALTDATHLCFICFDAESLSARNADGHRRDGDCQANDKRRSCDELGKRAIAALARSFAEDRMRKSDRVAQCCGHGPQMETNQHAASIASDTGGG